MQRRSGENWLKAMVCAGAGVGLVCGPGRALAQSGHVGNRCSRLSASGYQEVDARILLLLRGQPAGRPLPVVVCTEQGSWVEWEDRRLPITGKVALEDEVVDLVEAALNEAKASPDGARDLDAAAAAEPPSEQEAAASPTPARARPADPIAEQASDARGGGVLVGMEAELPSDDIGVAFGPAFDFATNVGPLLLGGHEAFRVAPGDAGALFMDFQGTVALGAPLDPSALFGLVGRFGAEWMVADPPGNSRQAKVVPIADVGVRVAHAFRFVSLWIGLDARFRLTTLELRTATSSLAANDVGGSATLGVAFVDWSRK